MSQNETLYLINQSPKLRKRFRKLDINARREVLSGILIFDEKLIEKRMREVKK
jgi:hypothetical protein